MLYCVEEAGRQGQLTDQAGRKWTYEQLTGRAQATKGFARWMMGLGRLGQFALAKRLLYEQRVGGFSDRDLRFTGCELHKASVLTYRLRFFIRKTVFLSKQD